MSWVNYFYVKHQRVNMYLFLSSEDSIESHPGNNAWSFHVDIPQCIHLKGEWECALMDIHYTGDYGELYIHCDLARTSYVLGKFLPLLRIISKPLSYVVNPYFIPISHNFISHIKIYITTKNGSPPSLTPEHLRCTLQLRSI